MKELDYAVAIRRDAVLKLVLATGFRSKGITSIGEDDVAQLGQLVLDLVQITLEVCCL